MSRILTLTWRGPAWMDELEGQYADGLQAIYDDVNAVATPTGMDNPSFYRHDYAEFWVDLGAKYTAGRLGFKVRRNAEGNLTRVLALYEDTTCELAFFGWTDNYFKNVGTYDYVGYTGSPMHLSQEFSMSLEEGHVFEIAWTCAGASGWYKVYWNGIEVVSETSMNLGTNGLNKILLGSYTNTYPQNYWIEWLIADSSPTEELAYQKFARLSPNGAGNTTGMTPKPSGSNYALVDEAIADYGDYVLADAADEKDTYALPACPSDVASIQAVRVMGVAAQQAEGALKARSVVRTGATPADYEGSSIDIPSYQYQFGHRWENNPNTSSPWTTSEIDSMEAGMKAVSS